MGEERPVEKKKITRTAKPEFAILSVKDNAGQTIDIPKENVTVHQVVNNADLLVDALDSGSHPKGSFYIRIPLS